MGVYQSGVKYRGINRAGAEYGEAWDGWTGETFYDIPNSADLQKELNFYANKGFNAIRFPIAWERLQHQLKGNFDATYKGLVEGFINKSTERGYLVIVDLHNYNRYATDAFNAAGVQVNTYQQRIYGDGVLGVSDLVDVWTRLAVMFQANTQVAFGIMNEPHDFYQPYDTPSDSNTWFSDLHIVIDAIRATGANQQLILVPNTRGSDVSHWDEYPPIGGPNDSVAALQITDSANNYAFDMHQYYDGNTEESKPYLGKIAKVTAWAKKNGRKLFLSEFGVGYCDDLPEGVSNGGQVIGEVLEHLNSNSDVWIGWTPWNLKPYYITEPGSNYQQDGVEMPWYTDYLTPNIVDIP